uniref:Uncharacterized protein n=1 Tax=Anopheles epiroticus TaxID=199890 RepID=A0A182P9P0_9DIPT
MLGHSPHSNTNHLGAPLLHATSSSVRSSSQSSVAAASAVPPAAPGGSQHIVTLSSSLSSSSASSTGTIQPVHHRTRSLPLTEESAIRITSEHRGQGAAGGGWWQQPHHHPSLPHYNHLQYGQQQQQQQQHYATSFSSIGASHRKSSSAYLPAPSGHMCSLLNGGGGGGGGWSPPVSDVLCTSPHRQYELSHDGNGTPFASLVPSRSSMESIIEDQRYLPMDLKKPSDETVVGPGEAAGSALPLISRLLRSSNLQPQPSSASPSTSASPATLSAGKMGLLGLKMAMMAEGRTLAGPIGSASNNGGHCGCSSSPSSQCSSSSNCNHAISSNTTTTTNITTTTTTTSASSHKSTNGSSPAALRRLSAGRTASGTISRSINSPPVNSSPLSPPPPASYSTGSDGSSLSIDGESTDSFVTGSLTPDEGQGYPKVINQLNSGCSIPEENSEEFIKDYGHIDLRAAGCGLSAQHDDFAVPASRRGGGSPAPPSTVGSVEGSAYMEMCSPSGSSPGDPSGSCYMPMSPVADFSRGLCSSSSAHSRASSLAEDLVDGYVPMSMPRTAATAASAVPSSEEYVLMDPSLNGAASSSSRLSNATSSVGGHNHVGGGIGASGGMSSAASSCSITSGTPSADLRLSLEKVPAYIGQSSDDHEVNDRPFRTYSVGSRPELIKRKLRVEMLSSGESSVGGSGGSASSRQRAFSVGSRAKVPRCSDVYKGYSAAPVIVSFASTSSQGSMLESSNNNSSSSTSSISHAGSYGASIGDTLPMDELAAGGSMGRKSGSGSLLPDGKPPSHGGSHGRMSDLMEIDYSSPRQPKPSTTMARSSEPAGMEDYLDMSGNNNEEEQRRGGGQVSSGYVEMRPGRLNSQSEENDYLNMTPGSSRGPATDEPDCPGVASSNQSTTSPIQIQPPVQDRESGVGGGSAGQHNNTNNNNYLEMYPRAALPKEQNRGSVANATTTSATKVPSEDYLNMAPLMISSLGEASGSEEKMNHQHAAEDESIESSSAPDGYMEMSWNHGVVTTGPSASATSASSSSNRNVVPTNGGDDYMNMSCGSQSEDASRAYSAPITIQPSAGKCRLDLSGESKVEAGANIPNYLPLGQHPDARKSVHHPHHHHHHQATIVALQQHLPLTAQAPIQTTTGQQSGSIGFSPSKPSETTPERARCDSRDSGIVTPSGSQPTIFPFSPASPTKPFAPVTATTTQDEPMVESLEDLSQNYAELSLGRQHLQQQQQQQQQQQHGEQPSSVAITRKLSTGSRGSGSFGKLQILANQPDYVNFCPTTPPTDGPQTISPLPLNVPPSSSSSSSARSRIEDDGAGDYALMNPAACSRKHSTTSMGSTTGSTQPGVMMSGTVTPSSGSNAADNTSPPVLVARKSTLLLSSPQMGFKPIASSQDVELLLHGKLPLGPSANSPKALNLGRRPGEPAFSFTEQQQQQLPPLQRSISTGTRPNSVNSELIGRAIGGNAASGTTAGSSGAGGSSGTASTRPSSANSERLPIISATSSSASSTSTLCESKNQSPSASCTALASTNTSTTSPSAPGSRPDSVSSITDPHIVSRPPSVSSERELHYASLDLPPCSSGGSKQIASPFAPGTMMLLAAAATGSSAGVTKMEVDEPLPGSNESRNSIDSINSSSPSPGSHTQTGCNLQQQPVRCAAFTYAQIDFVRSQAQSQPGAPGSGPTGSSGNGGTTSTSTPQSSQA